MNRIILISGKAESGKDSIACIMKEKLYKSGKKVLIIHYADYLKFIASKYFGWNGEKDDYGRKLLQHLGTDFVRGKSPNFWVDIVLRFLIVFADSYDFVIIPDTRFPNEIESIKWNFSTISLRVIRLNYESKLTEEQQKHPSECALDSYKFDYTIKSESGLNNLEVEVEKFFKYLEVWRD